MSHNFDLGSHFYFMPYNVKNSEKNDFKIFYIT